MHEVLYYMAKLYKKNISTISEKELLNDMTALLRKNSPEVKKKKTEKVSLKKIKDEASSGEKGVVVKDLVPLSQSPSEHRMPRDVHELARQLSPIMESILLPRRVVLQIAEEVAVRLKRRSSAKKVANKGKSESAFVLDTSAIIDQRIFDLVKLGVFQGSFILLESVLGELKRIADLKDEVKKERGKRALKDLDNLRKDKYVKLIILKDEEKVEAVDDKIIQYARRNKARILTCDFNLSKKARISGVVSIDIHEMANVLKTQAIPGEVFWVKIIQKGKGQNQGVGYLPDGTMIVVEEGENLIDKTVQVTVSRIIQTEAGKILFSKLMAEKSG